MPTERKLDAILAYVRTHPDKTYIDPTEIIDNVLPGESPASVAVLLEFIQKEGAASVNMDNDPPGIWYSATLDRFLMGGTFRQRKSESKTKSELLRWQRIVFWPAVVLGCLGGADTVIGWVASPEPASSGVDQSLEVLSDSISILSLPDTTTESTEFQSPSGHSEISE